MRQIIPVASGSLRGIEGEDRYGARTLVRRSVGESTRLRTSGCFPVAMSFLRTKARAPHLDSHASTRSGAFMSFCCLLAPGYGTRCAWTYSRLSMPVETL